MASPCARARDFPRVTSSRDAAGRRSRSAERRGPIEIDVGRLRRVIVGRDPELSRIRDLVESARGGRGGALVIAGEAGIGKSALIQEALAGFTDQRWLQGAEAERDLPYAALGTLCLPYVDRFGVLSEAHRCTRCRSFGSPLPEG